MSRQYTRRTFLTVSTAAAAGLVTRRRTLGRDLNGKLRLAAIGTGNKGGDDLRARIASDRIVAHVERDPAAQPDQRQGFTA